MPIAKKTQKLEYEKKVLTHEFVFHTCPYRGIILQKFQGGDGMFFTSDQREKKQLSLTANVKIQICPHFEKDRGKSVLGLG